MHTKPRPLISVLLAYYNDTKHVEAAIKSVLAQSFNNIELIVVDDFSPDEAARKYIVDLSKEYSFSLIKHPHNWGATKAFRTAYEESHGEYISIISHDDLYASDKLEYMLPIMEERNLDVLYCNGSHFEEEGIEKAVRFDDNEVMAAQKNGQASVAELISSKDTIGCLLTQGALYKRHVWEEQKFEREKYLLDDWPFTIITWRKYKTYYDAHNVYYYRLHRNNAHKEYLKWLPARIQTICELADPEKKINTMSYIFTDVGIAAFNDGDINASYKLVSCGLILAETDKNILFAKKYLKDISRKRILNDFNFKILFLLAIEMGFIRIAENCDRLKRKIKAILKCAIHKPA
jgi:glycosyltransferase involved in cell wall biosynthesis